MYFLKVLFYIFLRSIKSVKCLISMSIGPLFLSLISALIFYYFVTHLPNKQKEKIFETKITNDMFKISRDMFYIFNQVMKHDSHSPSRFQKEIRNGLLTEEDLVVGLQNKVLNEKHLNLLNPEFRSNSLIVGNDIYMRKEKILHTIEQLYPFINYISDEEFLVFERIKALALQRRNPETEPCHIVNNQKLCVENPTMNGNEHKFLKWYQEYIKLKKILLFERGAHTSSIVKEKVFWMYYNEDYENLLDKLYVYKNKYDLHVLLVKKYKYLSLNKLGKTKKSLETFKKFISNFHQDPTGYRNFFMELDENSQEWKSLEEKFTSDQLLRMARSYQDDTIRKKAFLLNADKIKTYYEIKKK